MNEGVSYEFGPGGPRPLQDAGPQGGIINARDAIAQMRALGQAETPVALLPEQKPKTPKAPKLAEPSAPIKRQSFVPELRARLRIVEAEIRRLRGLEDEQAELRRLIAAAKARPAGVTDINQARKSG